MSISTSNPGGEQIQSGLFSDEELPVAEAPGQVGVGRGTPRVMRAQRNQLELRPCDLDSLLSADHPVRTVWAFVQSLDLAPLYARIRSVEGGGGAPAIDPAILVSLWLWATIDGVGSAREVDRLCERDDAYRWLCGGVGVNYHTLATFRTEQAAWLDAQLTRSIASLLDRGLIKLDVVSQDGMRVRSAAKAASFRRKSRLQQLHAAARAQVEALKQELEADASASSRRKQAARERAAREREQRLAQALNTLQEIERLNAPKKATPDESGKSDPPNDAPKAKDKAAKELRVSTTDPEARVMKMADGGFRPAFNTQLAVDAETQLIAAVDVVNAGSDMRQMAPMHAALVERYGRTPAHWLADGGFTKLEAIETLSQNGTQGVLPAPASRHVDVDPLAPKKTDTPGVAQWREFMQTEQAKALYLQRAASVECANAQLRRRGLLQFNVRGLHKAKAVMLWHALAHNLMRMRSLNFSFAT